MFLPYKETPKTGKSKIVEATCLSTDSKPTTGILQGSLCIEIDTGKVFIFSGTNWIEEFSFQS